MEESSAWNDDIRITAEKINDLKHKYSQELKDSPDNPMKVCMKLIFEGATERDLEKRSSSAYKLSEFLTKPGGVINLFLALIDFDNSSQKETTHSQRFVAVANIITCLPKLCMPYEDFCNNIFQQLKPLLIDHNSKYSSLAAIIIKALIESPHAKKDNKKIIELVIRPILDSFSQASSVYRLDEAITAIHNLVINRISSEQFVEIFPHLILGLKILNDSPSHLKPLLTTILVCILNELQPGAACCLIEKTLFYIDIPDGQYEILPQDNGVSLKFADNTERQSTDRRTATLRDIILTLLEASDNKLLMLEFYFYFQDTVWSSMDPNQCELSASLIEPFLEESSQDDSASKFDIYQIIAMNRQKSLDLLARTLLNHRAYLSSAGEDLAIKFKHIEQSISSCLSILEVLYTTLCDKNDKILVMTKCEPVLKEISEMLSNSPNLKDATVIESIKSFLKQLRGERSEDLELKITNAQEKELSSIVKDLNDELVPVRVHGLVRLKQMILSNDPFILPKIPRLYSMIECSLADPEPYVFLACINLLAEMALRDTPNILPKLKELYSRKDVSLQTRINVGEVLVRLVKQLNETTPHYAPQVINLLLTQCKDSEELVRMSSLANIGETCKSLGSSIGKYMAEILCCVRGISYSDTEEVKHAAIDLLRTALSGMDAFGAEAIQRDLKEIYGMLKRAGAPLTEINRLASELIGVESGTSHQRGTDRMAKNIKVLSLLG